jgi:hypothetical protein
MAAVTGFGDAPMTGNVGLMIGGIRLDAADPSWDMYASATVTMLVDSANIEFGSP